VADCGIRQVFQQRRNALDGQHIGFVVRETEDKKRKIEETTTTRLGHANTAGKCGKYGCISRYGLARHSI